MTTLNKDLCSLEMQFAFSVTQSSIYIFINHCILMHVFSLDAFYIKSFSNYYHLLLSPSAVLLWSHLQQNTYRDKQSEDKKKILLSTRTRGFGNRICPFHSSCSMDIKEGTEEWAWAIKPFPSWLLYKLTPWDFTGQNNVFPGIVEYLQNLQWNTQRSNTIFIYCVDKLVSLLRQEEIK